MFACVLGITFAPLAAPVADPGDPRNDTLPYGVVLDASPAAPAPGTNNQRLLGLLQTWYPHRLFVDVTAEQVNDYITALSAPNVCGQFSVSN